MTPSVWLSVTIIFNLNFKSYHTNVSRMQSKAQCFHLNFIFCSISRCYLCVIVVSIGWIDGKTHTHLFHFFFLDFLFVVDRKCLFVYFFFHCGFVIDTDYMGSKPPKQNHMSNLDGFTTHNHYLLSSVENLALCFNGASTSEMWMCMCMCMCICNPYNTIQSESLSINCGVLASFIVYIVGLYLCVRVGFFRLNDRFILVFTFFLFDFNLANLARKSNTRIFARIHTPRILQSKLIWLALAFTGCQCGWIHCNLFFHCVL